MLRKLILGALLVWFGTMTVLAIREFGYWGSLEWMQLNSATRLLSLDLTILLGLAIVWMFRDAESKAYVLPFALLSLAFGAAGPLLYLLLRDHRRKGCASPGEG